MISTSTTRLVGPAQGHHAARAPATSPIRPGSTTCASRWCRPSRGSTGCTRPREPTCCAGCRRGWRAEDARSGSCSRWRSPRSTSADDRTRKVHHLIYLPDLDAVDRFNTGAGTHRQPRLRRPADPRPRLPRPAGDHAGGQPGRLPGAGPHLDALVLRPGLQVGLRRDRRLLRRPGRPHLRGGDRPVVRPGDELAGVQPGRLPAGVQLGRALAAGAGPRGDRARQRAGLLRGQGRPAHRRRSARDDRVLPRGGQVPRRRAPGLRRQLVAGADPRGRRPVSRVRQAAHHRRAAPGRGAGRPTGRLPPRRRARRHAPDPAAEIVGEINGVGPKSKTVEAQLNDAGRGARPGAVHPARRAGRRDHPNAAASCSARRSAGCGAGEVHRTPGLRRGVRRHPALRARRAAPAAARTRCSTYPCRNSAPTAKRRHGGTSASPSRRPRPSSAGADPLRRWPHPRRRTSRSSRCSPGWRRSAPACSTGSTRCSGWPRRRPAGRC